MNGKSLPHNQLSFTEKVQMAAVLAPTPLVLAWTFVSSYFTPDGRARSTKKTLVGGATSWIFKNMNRQQTRSLFGDTNDAYDAYVKSLKIEPIIDELGQEGRLLWIAPRKEKRVILYLHGGAFMFGCLPSAPHLLKYVQEKLEKNGKPTDIAILNYSLIPDAIFPTQLTQLVLAINYLTKTGIMPENIQLVGDSAGGLLIHELVSHVLHPLPEVPQLEVTGEFGGAYLLSPWTCLTDNPLVRSNLGKGDMLDLNRGIYWGTQVLEGVEESVRKYLNPVEAPDDWLKGIDTVIKRIMISAGDSEILRDAIIDYKQTVERYHNDVTFFLEDYGIHDDPFVVFMLQEKDLGKLIPAFIHWLDEGFATHL